jgi:hypothetical protein
MVLVVGLFVASSSFALSAWWHGTSGARPTYLPPNGTGEIVVTVENLGDANASGAASPIQVADVLPPGLKATSIVAGVPAGNGFLPLSCSLESLTCTLTGTVPIYGLIEVRIGVAANGAKTGEVNRASVSGGGISGISIEKRIIVSSEPVPFGIENHVLAVENEGGGPGTQAGSHPFQLTDTVDLNQGADATPLEEKPTVNPAVPVKDLVFKLPAGLIGDPTAIPRCTLKQFLTHAHDSENECPSQSAIGVAVVSVREPNLAGALTFSVPLFNLEPSTGEPARFGFFVLLGNAPVYLDTVLRTGGDYGVTVNVNNITQTAAFLSSEVTFWGVPGDPRHDNARNWRCLEETRSEPAEGPCKALEESHPPAFLSIPTSCSHELLKTTIEGDSWLAPGDRQEYPTEPMQMLDGCNQLPFSPSIKVTPDGRAGSTPTGLNVDVHVPQEGSKNGAGLSSSNIKAIEVKLPEGVALNPAAADGLQACGEREIGFTGFGEFNPVTDQGDKTALFTSGIDDPFCPEAAKIGTVTIRTPLLPNPLEGSVYLSSQNANPFGSLVSMYIEAQDPVSGSLVKLPGEVSLDPVTGRIRSTFENTPQLAFEDAELHFFGGDRAPLATPNKCGTYTTEAVFTPWSGNPSVEADSSFEVVSGPNGSPCPNPVPFSPSLTAGTTSIQAGGFTPFTMTVSREDGQQAIKNFQLHMPPGVSGLLNGVKLCGETEANTGTCGPDSLIGETTVSVGVGGDPYSVTGGKVYITGPYEGASFGVSVVVRAKAGPYDLGTVVVRGTIAVDPITAALTVTIDGTGPYKVPTILDGIPLQIRHINFTTTRPGFTFNPTDCDPLSVTGSMSSTEGATAPLSVPFQVTNCAILGFKPGFKVSTAGKTSRKSGASLSVKLTYPKAAFGSQANIKSVKVDLPKQLPSRLTTLQKACTAAQFQANPAGCPADSMVGHATAITPLIPVPLTGPAYFVSYGGTKFPELVIVLQGYGVTLDLHGETFINKAGITSSTFHTVPDAPVGSFELTLPQGPYSALAASGNLCKSTLKMPTAFTAQNGATIKQSTPITVMGCAKHVRHVRKKTARKKGK